MLGGKVQEEEDSCIHSIRKPEAYDPGRHTLPV